MFRQGDILEIKEFVFVPYSEIYLFYFAQCLAQIIGYFLKVHHKRIEGKKDRIPFQTQFIVFRKV